LLDSALEASFWRRPAGPSDMSPIGRRAFGPDYSLAFDAEDGALTQPGDFLRLPVLTFNEQARSAFAIDTGLERGMRLELAPLFRRGQVDHPQSTVFDAILFQPSLGLRAIAFEPTGDDMGNRQFRDIERPRPRDEGFVTRSIIVVSRIGIVAQDAVDIETGIADPLVPHHVPFEHARGVHALEDDIDTFVPCLGAVDRAKKHIVAKLRCSDLLAHAGHRTAGVDGIVDEQDLAAAIVLTVQRMFRGSSDPGVGAIEIGIEIDDRLVKVEGENRSGEQPAARYAYNQVYIAWHIPRADRNRPAKVGYGAVLH